MGTVAIYVAGFTGDEGNRLGIAGASGSAEKTKKETGQAKNGAIFAGSLRKDGDDRIEQRRARARQEASRALKEQFDRDNEITDRQDELRGRNKEIKGEIADIRDQVKGIRDWQEELRVQHGVMPDSEEQKKLDMIRKVNDCLKTGNWKGLTKDDLIEIASMDPTQLTSYQRKCLEGDDAIETIEKDLPDLEKEARANTSTVVTLRQGLLKTSYKGISKAYDSADVIRKAASEDIIGMLKDDAKNFVDEKLQEIIEAAKKKAEEMEEEEKKKEAAEEKKQTQEELTQAIKEAASEQKQKLEAEAVSVTVIKEKPAEENDKMLDIAKEQEDLQKSVEKMLREAGLMEDDFKGLMINGFF